MSGRTGDCGPILVVDDDEGVCELLRGLLAGDAPRVLCLGTGEAALRAAERERPSLVVLEVKLPGISGYEVCRALRDRFGPGLPIVFVSGDRTQAHDRVAGMLLGADDYLAKPVPFDHLLARVRRLVAQSAPVAGPIPSRLTPREQEVLALLADGLEQDDIARRLFISPKTVAKHIERILSKLGVHSRAQAVVLALRGDSSEGQDGGAQARS
jgi:DNA-binding NarL/FixJ family response regulator